MKTAIPFYTSMTWEIYSIRHTATVCAQSKSCFRVRKCRNCLLVGVAPKDRESEYTPFPKRHLFAE
nr:hypothetical protein [Bacillus licheniformis]